jgi:hypothetical protein
VLSEIGGFGTGMQSGFHFSFTFLLSESACTKTKGFRVLSLVSLFSLSLNRRKYNKQRCSINDRTVQRVVCFPIVNYVVLMLGYLVLSAF